MLGFSIPEIELPEEIDFEVFPDNMPILQAFFTLDGCAWQYSGMGDLIGLDYPAAKIIWDYAGVVLDKEQFQGVMLFSRTVVNELKKKKDK